MRSLVSIPVLLTSPDQLANPTIRLYVLKSETVAVRAATIRGQGNDVSSPSRAGEQRNVNSSQQASRRRRRDLRQSRGPVRRRCVSAGQASKVAIDPEVRKVVIKIYPRALQDRQQPKASRDPSSDGFSDGSIKSVRGKPLAQNSNRDPDYGIDET